MASNEHTSLRIAAIAAVGVSNPAALTLDEIAAVCASALTQAPDRRRSRVRLRRRGLLKFVDDKLWRELGGS